MHEEPATAHPSVQLVEQVSSHEVPSTISSGEPPEVSAQSSAINASLANPEELTWANAIRFDPESTDPIEIDYSRMDDAELSRMVAMFEDADPVYHSQFPLIPVPMPTSAGPTSELAPTFGLPDPLMSALTFAGPTSKPAPTFVFTDPLGGQTSEPSATQPLPTAGAASADGADEEEGTHEEEEEPREEEQETREEAEETRVGTTRRSARESRAPRAADASWAKKNALDKNARPKKQTLVAKPASKPAAKPAAKRRAAGATPAKYVPSAFLPHSTLIVI